MSAPASTTALTMAESEPARTTGPLSFVLPPELLDTLLAQVADVLNVMER